MVRDGVAAEEPTLLLGRPDTAEAVLRSVGPSPYLTTAPALTQPGDQPCTCGQGQLMQSGYARAVQQEPAIPPARWPSGGAWKRC